MKNPHILTLFLIGVVITMIGVLLKITYSPMGDFFLIIGMTFDTVSVVLLIYKLIKKNNSNSFLDS